MIGVGLSYYDVAYESCNLSKELERKLGYDRIFVAGKEVKVIDGNFKSSDLEGSIFVNSNQANLFSILSFSPKAIVFSDSKINKKALEQMRDRDMVLCIPMNLLMTSVGLQRSRNLYLMGRLFDHAKSLKLDVSFVTLSKSLPIR